MQVGVDRIIFLAKATQSTPNQKMEGVLRTVKIKRTATIWDPSPFAHSEICRKGQIARHNFSFLRSEQRAPVFQGSSNFGQSNSNRYRVF